VLHFEVLFGQVGQILRLHASAIPPASERHKSWVTDHDCSPRGALFPATHCCRLASGRDHFGPGFAMGMGTTSLPLMGPSTGS